MKFFQRRNTRRRGICIRGSEAKRFRLMVDRVRKARAVEKLDKTLKKLTLTDPKI